MIEPIGTDDASTAASLDQALQTEAATAATHLVLDLTRAENLGAAALGVIAAVLFDARDTHRRVQIACPAPLLRRLLEILVRITGSHATTIIDSTAITNQRLGLAR